MGEVVPHDLVKYGLIPELVGRLPVITALDGLDQEALVRILTEPKNSILKQYKKLFALDKVELDFEKSALEAVAQKAIDRRTGARGLRSIMEETLTDLMYKVPSDYSVEKVIVDGETVKNGREAKLIHNPDRKPVAITISETKKARTGENIPRHNQRLSFGLRQRRRAGLGSGSRRLQPFAFFKILNWREELL